MIYSERFIVSSTKGTELLDITQEIRSVVNNSSIKEGIVTIFSSHTTTAVGINENEPRIVMDYEDLLEKLVPKGVGYRHDSIDSNAQAHLRSLVLGVGEVVPIEDGSLCLGTWQSIFFIELDGPRRRTVMVKIIGE